jgi:hypothetical protein
MKEQRRQPRYLCSALVTLYWQNGRERHKAAVLLENISAFGACLQAEFGLPEGARVRIACGRQSFRGVVRYCLLTVGGWFIGVELDGFALVEDKVPARAFAGSAQSAGAE